MLKDKIKTYLVLPIGLDSLCFLILSFYALFFPSFSLLPLSLRLFSVFSFQYLSFSSVYFQSSPKMILPLLFMRAPIPFFLFLIDIYFLKENPIVQFLGRLRSYSLTHSHLLINSFFF